MVELQVLSDMFDHRCTALDSERCPFTEVVVHNAVCDGCLVMMSALG